MKIVFLNALDGELHEPLRIFLQKHKPDTDIFCFQECSVGMKNLQADFAEDFTEVSVTKPIQDHPDEAYNNTTLVRKTYTVEKSWSNEAVATTGLSLYITIRTQDGVMHIANMHGLPKPGKLDTPERLQQSQELLDAFANLTGPKIIGGDLNVLPETTSVQSFVQAGYQDLIKNFDIKTTRNSIAWSKYPGNELYYSDYVFVQHAEVISFEVPSEIVSDHQPMILKVKSGEF